MDCSFQAGLDTDEITTLNEAKAKLGVDKVETFVFGFPQDQIPPIDEWKLKVKKSILQLKKNLQYYGMTLTQFVETKEYIAILDHTIRTVVKDRGDIEEVKAYVLEKLASTCHIEKFDPTLGNFKSHIFMAVRTTWISLISNHDRSVTHGSISLYNSGKKFDDHALTEVVCSRLYSKETLLLNGKPISQILASDPGNQMVIREELDRFGAWVDELESPIVSHLPSGEMLRTPLSTVFFWYWPWAHKGEDTAQATAEDMCQSIGIRESTFRRYWDKLRYRFIEFFGIDLPLRLWGKRVDYLTHGTKEFTQVATCDFLDRQYQRLLAVYKECRVRTDRSDSQYLQKRSPELKTTTDKLWLEEQSALEKLEQWCIIAKPILKNYLKICHKSYSRKISSSSKHIPNSPKFKEWQEKNWKSVASVERELRRVEHLLAKFEQDPLAVVEVPKKMHERFDKPIKTSAGDRVVLHDSQLPGEVIGVVAAELPTVVPQGQDTLGHFQGTGSETNTELPIVVVAGIPTDTQ